MVRRVQRQAQRQTLCRSQGTGADLVANTSDNGRKGHNLLWNLETFVRGSLTDVIAGLFRR